MEELEVRKGGKRKGAGRKPAPYKTKTIAFRIRVEWLEVIKSTVKAKVAELSQNSQAAVSGSFCCNHPSTCIFSPDGKVCFKSDVMKECSCNKNDR